MPPMDASPCPTSTRGTEAAQQRGEVAQVDIAIGIQIAIRQRRLARGSKVCQQRYEIDQVNDAVVINVARTGRRRSNTRPNRADANLVRRHAAVVE